MHPDNRRLVHTQGPVLAASLPCHSPAHSRYKRCHARRGALCTSPCTRNCAGGPSRRALQFRHPVLVWQAEEAVANLPLRLAVRGHCGHPACAQHDRAHARLGTPAALNLRVLLRCSRGTHPRGTPLPESTRGTARLEECSAAIGRARRPLARLENACSFDLMCRCRGWSCS